MGRVVSAAERRFSGGRALCLFSKKQAEIALQAASGVCQQTGSCRDFERQEPGDGKTARRRSSSRARALYT